MKKIGIFSLIIVTTLFLISCASVPKTGFNREKMNVCNMMGYSNDALAIKFAKEIWNDKVDVVSLEENQEFVIAYDINNKNSFTIFVDPEKKGLDYSTELATLTACIGYIRENQNDTNVIANSKDYADKIYHLIIENVLKNNKVTFENKDNFEKYLNELVIEFDGTRYCIK